jgi:alkanesulfonate monooxygenase SsuD/methylene tetrahydromethanopterin reductase-like flavin-dependent oxidoreductase (luciferase family)
VIVGGFGPKMAELAGRVADGINLPDGGRLPQLLSVARAARVSLGRDPSSFIVTVSASPSARTLERLTDLGVGRVIAFVQAPFVDRVRVMAAGRHS